MRRKASQQRAPRSIDGPPGAALEGYSFYPDGASTNSTPSRARSTAGSTGPGGGEEADTLSKHEAASSTLSATPDRQRAKADAAAHIASIPDADEEELEDRLKALETRLTMCAEATHCRSEAGPHAPEQFLPSGDAVYNAWKHKRLSMTAGAATTGRHAALAPPYVPPSVDDVKCVRAFAWRLFNVELVAAAVDDVELRREEQYNAAIAANLEAEAHERELRRQLEQDRRLAAAQQAEERYFFGSADPLISKLRRDAKARNEAREAEARLAEEAEASRLEARCDRVASAILAAGPASPSPPPTAIVLSGRLVNQEDDDGPNNSNHQPGSSAAASIIPPPLPAPCQEPLVPQQSARDDDELSPKSSARLAADREELVRLRRSVIASVVELETKQQSAVPRPSPAEDPALLPPIRRRSKVTTRLPSDEEFLAPSPPSQDTGVPIDSIAVRPLFPPVNPKKPPSPTPSHHRSDFITTATID